VNAVPCGKADKACDDALEVFERQGGRERERKQRQARRRPHRGQIAQIDGQRAMANRVGGYKGAIEVDTFDERIDAQCLDAVPLRLDDRRIVADADKQPVRGGRQILLDARDQIALAQIPNEEPGA
jgi:hypothetical protein